MATTHGNNGTVKIGANTLAEIRSFRFNEQASVADDSEIGDAWDTHIAGEVTKRWTGECECWWDATDTNGQETLTVGASVTLAMYPEGAATSAVYYTGTATVTAINSASQRGSTVERSFSFQGNGALTRTVVGA